MAGRKAFEVEDALDRAMLLFWRRGYEATSLPDLVKEMGIGRQSMYDTFGTKHDLFLAALARYCDVYAAALLERLEAPNASLIEVQSYLEANVESYFGSIGARSCFMVNSTMELASRDPEVRDRVGRFHRRIERAFSRALTNAIETGEMGSDESASAVARRLLSLALGVPVYVRGGASKRLARDTIRTTIASLRRSS